MLTMRDVAECLKQGEATLWVKEKPKFAGWYWWRPDVASVAIVVLLSNGCFHSAVEIQGRTTFEFGEWPDGEWIKIEKPK